MKGKALVTGGGIGGLATAVAPRRAGWAIEDAVILAVCLARSTGVAEALRDYESRRIPRSRRVVRESRRAGTIAQWSNPLACRFRDARLRTRYAARKQARQLEWMFTTQV
jgi:2-polyprenyl-6-methoxyphenol hydroxylase-like FAD-dependent oxidoreductase